MRFHEIRDFTVPGINFNEVTSGIDPATGAPLGKVENPGILDRIKGFFTTKPKGPTREGFQTKLREIAEKLGVEADHLLKIIKFETAGTLDTEIASGTGTGATGLIQFMPKVARALGTSTEKLAKMTPEEQLDYVYKFYKMNKLPPGSSLSDIYLYTYMPATLKTGQGDDFVLGKKGAYGKKIWDVDLGQNWDSNPVFAREAIKNKRNYFTIGDVRNVINKS